jgi:hypothetical protein
MNTLVVQLMTIQESRRFRIEQNHFLVFLLVSKHDEYLWLGDERQIYDKIRRRESDWRPRLRRLKKITDPKEYQLEKQFWTNIRWVYDIPHVELDDIQDHILFFVEELKRVSLDQPYRENRGKIQLSIGWWTTVLLLCTVLAAPPTGLDGPENLATFFGGDHEQVRNWLNSSELFAGDEVNDDDVLTAYDVLEGVLRTFMSEDDQEQERKYESEALLQSVEASEEQDSGDNSIPARADQPPEKVREEHGKAPSPRRPKASGGADNPQKSLYPIADSSKRGGHKKPSTLEHTGLSLPDRQILKRPSSEALRGPKNDRHRQKDKANETSHTQLTVIHNPKKVKGGSHS